MSNAYVFEDAPTDGVGGPGSTGPTGQTSPVPFVLLVIAALVLAAVIVVLLVRCCGSDSAPEIVSMIERGIGRIGRAQ